MSQLLSPQVRTARLGSGAAILTEIRIARFELGAKPLVAMSNKLRVSLPGAVTEPDSR